MSPSCFAAGQRCVGIIILDHSQIQKCHRDYRLLIMFHYETLLEKKFFIWMCIKNKNYMENWLFWGLNLGNLKQCMMIMLVLTSSSSAWTLCSLLHISSLINICNFYSFWATGMVLTSKWGRILQEIHCQCQIWLKWSAAGRRPANFHKRNYLLSVNTTDFEITTIQAHSAVSRVTPLEVAAVRGVRGGKRESLHRLWSKILAM